MPYLGKDGDKVAVNLGATVVKKLVEPLHNSGRNITCDRYFTGVEMIETLKSNNLPVVGAVMPNEKYLPVELAKKAGRLVGSSLFSFKDDLTMCLWVPKKNKLVLLLSIGHQSDKIGESRKPEIVEFYNETKAGVDALDQKVRHYTTYCKTKRWSMVVFYIILDIAAYNAYVLFKLLPASTGFNLNHRPRYRFLMMLREMMIKPNIVTRSQLVTGLNLNTTIAVQVFKLEVRPQANQRKIAKEEVKKGRCHMCPLKEYHKRLFQLLNCLVFFFRLIFSRKLSFWSNNLTSRNSGQSRQNLNYVLLQKFVCLKYFSDNIQIK